MLRVTSKTDPGDTQGEIELGMESNIQGINGETQLDEPHFDRESTVLSARPVVPLEKVEGNTFRLGKLTIWMIIGAALLIGAFGATLIYKLAGSDQTQVVENGAAEEIEPVKLESGVAGLSDSIVEPTAPEPIRALPEKEIVTPKPAVISKAPKVTKQDRFEDEIARRREARREARQQKRAEREARRSDPDRPRRVRKDLSKIEEIFEGVRRP